MRYWVEDLGGWLQAQGVGTWGGDTFEFVPAKRNPDLLAVVLTPTQGLGVYPGTQIYQPRLQVMCRSRTPSDAKGRAYEILDALKRCAPVILQERTQIHLCEAVAPPFFVGIDEVQAYRYSTNYQLSVGAL